MGARKRISAERRKEIKKVTYGAKLFNNPASPRKARLVADLIRGEEVNRALSILQHTKREAKMHKLLLSAISNWQSKNDGVRIEDSDLFVKEITVDGGRVLKRIRTAPQGRANRIKKRSNHITITLLSRTDMFPDSVYEEDSDELSQVSDDKAESVSEETSENTQNPQNDETTQNTKPKVKNESNRKSKKLKE
jgi:large subunit ribosomal protein L22